MLDRDTREQLYAVAGHDARERRCPVTVGGVHACPGVLGGMQWSGPAFNPLTGMLYVPAVDWCATYAKAKELRFVPGQMYMGGSYTLDPIEKSRGWLTAIDAATGAVKWRYESRRPMLAAVTTTAAGLVFTGELEGDFLALDANDGRVLYRFNTGGRLNGGDPTYEIERPPVHRGGRRQRDRFLARPAGGVDDRRIWIAGGAVRAVLFVVRLE